MSSFLTFPPTLPLPVDFAEGMKIKVWTGEEKGWNGKYEEVGGYMRWESACIYTSGVSRSTKTRLRQISVKSRGGI